MTSEAHWNPEQQGSRKSIWSSNIVRDNARAHFGDVYNIHGGMKTHGSDDEKILRWLDPSSPAQNHFKAQSYYEEGTCEWFVTSTYYLDWKLQNSQALWIYGSAGCCKTVLASVAIEDLRRNEGIDGNAILLYFYFSFDDARSHSYLSLLASLIAQMELTVELRESLKEARSREQRTAAELEALFIQACSTSATAYLVIDALDECPEDDRCREVIMAGLQRILAQCENIKLLIFSRAEQDIRSFMEDWGIEKAEIEYSAVSEDIKTFVEKCLADDAKLRRLPEDKKRHIAEWFAQKGDGMFRWAHCQLEELRRMKILTSQHITTVLERLPRTLDSTYERILSGIDDLYWEEARAALQFLAFSSRPLSVAELIDICITNCQQKPYVDEENRSAMFGILDLLAPLVHVSKTLNGPDFSELNVAHRPRHAMRPDTRPGSWSATNEDEWVDEPDDSSIFIDDITAQQTRDASISSSPQGSAEDECISSDTVRLAHFTVREYLTSNRLPARLCPIFALQAPSSHAFVAQTCASYLCHFLGYAQEDFQSFIGDGPEYDAPLYEYAALYWLEHQHHAEISSDDQKCTSLQLELLDNPIWRHTWQLRQDWITPDLVLKVQSQVMAAVGERVIQDFDEVIEAFDQADVVRAIHIVVHQDLRNTAAQMPISMRHLNTTVHGSVLLLPLSVASLRGHRKMVQALLHRGADCNAGGESHVFALHAAIMGGHQHIVDDLLAAGAWLDTHTDHFCYPLHTAARYDRVGNIMSRLLEAGAEVSRACPVHGTALQSACQWAPEAIVTLLLGEGAIPNTINSRSTPMQYALDRRRDLIPLLQKYGADVNHCNPEGKDKTALDRACKLGFESCARLLQEGADPGRLQCPKKVKDESVAWLLVQHHARALSLSMPISSLYGVRRRIIDFDLTDSSGNIVSRVPPWSRSIPLRDISTYFESFKCTCATETSALLSSDLLSIIESHPDFRFPATARVLLKRPKFHCHRRIRRVAFSPPDRDQACSRAVVRKVYHVGRVHELCCPLVAGSSYALLESQHHLRLRLSFTHLAFWRHLFPEGQQSSTYLSDDDQSSDDSRIDWSASSN